VEPTARPVPHGAAVYLAIVQFFFATTWIIYVIYLPSLLESVGIPRAMTAWILMIDQLTFTVTDFVMGFAADRVGRVVGRLGPAIVAVTVVSCLSFFLMPQLAAIGGGPVPAALFVLTVVIWVVTSSALRAPPWCMIARYAATPSLPWLAALALVGVGVGGAISPYLGVTLRNVDPRIPFAISSATLLVTTIGLIWVERALMRAAAAGWQEARVDEIPPLVTPPNAAFFLATTLLALGFQAHIAFNSIPQYLRYAAPADLDYLLPIFWVGFNLLSLPVAALTPRWGGVRVMMVAAVLGAVGALIAGLAPDLSFTVIGQALAGGAWGTIFFAGISTALILGRTGREGATSGLWFSTLAAAAFMRISIVAVQFDRAVGFQFLATWAPPLLWAAAALVLARLAWQMSTASRPLTGRY
jgi:MFS family permease